MNDGAPSKPAPFAVTAEPLRRVERAQVAAMGASDILDEPPDRFSRAFGGALGVICRTQPNTLFNRVSGFTAEDLPLLHSIIDWFAEHDIPPRIDIAPPLSSPAVTRSLHEAGLVPDPAKFLTRRVVLGRVSAHATDDASVESIGVDIQPAELSDLAAYLDIQMTIWPEDGGSRDDRLMRLRRSAGGAGLTRYLAWTDGAPAATASLVVHDGVAWLSAGATLPALRGRGCQTALIRRRLADARSAGCDLAGSLVSAASASERNLIRAGFVLGCDREVWMRPDWMSHPFYRDAG